MFPSVAPGFPGVWADITIGCDSMTGGSPGTGRVSDVFLTSSVALSGQVGMSPALLGTFPTVVGRKQLVAARRVDIKPVRGKPFLMRLAMVDSFFLFSVCCGFIMRFLLPCRTCAR